MNPQLLIVRIQSAIQPNAGENQNQLQMLAAEYAKLCEQSALRLEQCTALIKSGRDYLALQIAETEPALLDTLNILIFQEIDSWRAICKKYSIDLPDSFDDYQIELLQSLYTKNIGQNHPLYRDYRRAIRKQKFESALNIIRTISKINSNDAEAQREYLRLKNQILKTKADTLLSLLNSGESEELINAYTFLENENASDFIDPNKWQEASVKVKKILSENSNKRISELLDSLKNCDFTKDWHWAISSILEIKLLASDNEIEFDAKTLEFLENCAQTSAKAQEDYAKNTSLSKAMSAISTELEHPSLKNRKKQLKRLNQLKKIAFDFLDDETKSKLEKRISSLEWQITSARIKNVLSFCVVVAALLIAVGVGYNYKANRDVEKNASLAFEDIESNPSIESAIEALELFKKNYPALAENPAYSPKITKMTANLEFQKSEREKIINDLKDIENFDFENLTATAISDVQRRFTSLEIATKNLPKTDSIAAIDSLEKSKSTFNAKLENLKREILSKITIDLNTIDAHLKTIEKNPSNQKVELKECEDLFDSIHNTFVNKLPVLGTDNPQSARFDELLEIFTALNLRAQKITAAKDSLNNAQSINDYMALLLEIQDNESLPLALIQQIKKIQAKEATLKMGSYAKMFPSLPAYEKAAQDWNFAKAPDISSDPMLTDVFVYTKSTGAKAYTLGELKSSRNSWNTGYEVIQDGKEISNDGRIATIRKKQIQNSGKLIRDEIYTGGKITPEAVLARTLARQSPTALQSINLIAVTNANPLFKAYLEKRIFEEMSRNPLESGLDYSYDAQKRKDKVMSLANDLMSYSWMFANTHKEKLIATELYTSELPDFQSQADKVRQDAKNIQSGALKYLGYADELGNAKFITSKYSKVYGIDSKSGEYELLFENNKMLNNPAPFTPLIGEE